jgi:hypothetical protein
VAAAIVLLGGGAGTAAAVLPDRPAPLPPTTTITASPSPSAPTASASPTPTHSQSPSSPPPVSPDTHGTATTAVGGDIYVQTAGAGSSGYQKLLRHTSGGGWHVQDTLPHFSEATVSPDRTKMAWWDELTKPNTLMVSDLDGSHPKALFNTSEVDCPSVQWTADSQQIMFSYSKVPSGTDPGQTVVVQTIRPDGGNRRTISSDSSYNCGRPVPSADGQTLVSAVRSSPDVFQIVVTHADGSGRRVAPIKMPKGMPGLQLLALSPAGSLAVIAEGKPYGLSQPPYQCLVVNLATGATAQLDETNGFNQVAAFDSLGHIIVLADVNLDQGVGAPKPRLTVFDQYGKVLDHLTPPSFTSYGVPMQMFIVP